MALPWQRLFRYISVLVAILRPTDIGKNKNHHIGHQYDMYRYIPTHYNAHMRGHGKRDL